MIFRRHFEIKKGRHRASGLNFGISIADATNGFSFRFSKNCIYKKNQVTSSGVNKLCGFTYGFFPHQNSIRVGWQPLFDTDKIQLYAYLYCKGKRNYFPIGEVAAEREYEIKIDTDPYFVTFKFKGRSFAVPFKRKTRFGFKLFPYFGGRSKAPQTMNIYLKKH